MDPPRRSPRTNKKRERNTKAYEQSKLRKSIKYTQDEATSSRPITQQLASPPPRRSARVTKFSNVYGYADKKFPAQLLFENPCPHAGATFDKSKIDVHILTKREIRADARKQAFYVALDRARRSAPPREPVDICTIIQESRQLEAEYFRKIYRYGPGYDEKTCIWSAGGRFSWPEPSSGLTWVAVHGVGHTCAVSRRIPGMDPTRLSNSLKVVPELRRWSYFLFAVIAEMEDTSTTSAFFHKIDQSAKTSPFAVVSVAPHIDGSSSEASSALSGEKRSISFLDETLKDAKVFSTNETVQTAISALQHLYCQKFKSEEIVVCYMERAQDDPVVMSDDQVAEHLAATVFD